MLAGRPASLACHREPTANKGLGADRRGRRRAGMGGRARRAASLPVRRWALLRGAVLASRYSRMAARREHRGVLAVTTSGRSSAILDSKNRQLGKGFDVTAERTTSGMDSTRAPVDRAAAVTRSLLGYGVLAGACYLVVGLAQARTRDGLDLTGHDLSLLANGPYGWIQSANFILTALMVIAAAALTYHQPPDRRARSSQ